MDGPARPRPGAQELDGRRILGNARLAAESGVALFVSVRAKKAARRHARARQHRFTASVKP